MSNKEKQLVERIKAVARQLEELHKDLREEYGSVDDIGSILRNIHLKESGLPSPAVAQCFRILSDGLFNLDSYGSDELQISYGWAMSEALFYSIAANHRRSQSLLADYALYASATVLALKNLLRRCKESGRVATVFIATAQTPGELVYGTSEVFADIQKPYRTFNNINERYKFRFSAAVRQFTSEPRNYAIIERHIFAREKTNAPGDSGNLNLLDKFLTAVNRHYLRPDSGGGQESDADKKRRNLDMAEFQHWIAYNHACKLPGRPNAHARMARIQWFKEPDKENLRRITWEPDAICTDLIVFGSALKDDVPDASFPPTFNELDIDWEFGLQSIDLGVNAEGRVVKPLFGKRLKEYDYLINFLGFEEFNINDFIGCLQGVPGVESKVGFGKSGYIIEEMPWKEMWDKSRQRFTLPVLEAESPPLGQEDAPGAADAVVKSGAEKDAEKETEKRPQYDLFISYPRANKELPKAAYGKLAERGYRVFFDDNDVELGDSLSGQLEDAINDSAAFLVFLVERSKRGIQNDEIEVIAQLRQKTGRKVYVVRMKEGASHLRLSGLVSIEHNELQTKDPASHIAERISKNLPAPRGS